MKWYAKLYTRLVFIFLYLPIIVLIAFSFNESKSRASWTGFSFHWYKELFHNELILSSLRNTLIIALAASVIALVLGTMAAVGIYAMRRKWFKSLVMNITYLPILNPEIVTGVSMLLLFVSFGNGIQKFNNWIGGTALSFLQLPEMQLGFVTLIIAHVTFCTPYVILNVLPKLRQMDRFTFEAAQDLGCSPKLAFYKVVIPEIMPGMVSGFLMAFTYSLDDFVISYFVSSASSQTLPVTIFSMVRKRVSPEINAVSTLLFVTVLVLLAIVIAVNVFVARRCGFNKADEITIVFCGSKKSLANGIPMANILFPTSILGIMVLPLMIFHQIQLMVCAVLARRYKQQTDARLAEEKANAAKA